MTPYDASNARKVPLGLSLQKFAQRKIADAAAQLGGQLPCQVVSVAGQIVTVSFEVAAAPFLLPQVSMPIAAWLYDWIPVRAGDQGLTVASDVYLGGISGLGGGAADLSRPGNLAALAFLPVANSSWMPPGGDAAMRVVQGPDGVFAQDLTGAVTLTLSKANGVKATFAGTTVAVDTSGNVVLTLAGGAKLFVGGPGAADHLALVSLLVAAFNAHTHPDPQGGSTGIPTTPWTAATVESALIEVAS